MAVLQQSPWYQEILNQGTQQGLQQGIMSAIALGLELKFGEAGLELIPAVSQIKNLERLTELKDAIKTVNSLE